MAAAITTTATTLEGQFVEIARAIEAAEKAMPTTTRENRLDLTVDVANGAISVAATFAATVGGSGGSVSVSPTPYLP